MTLPASYKAKLFTESFYRHFLSTELQLEPNPVRLMPGGLEKVVRDGFTLLGAGSMDDREGSRTEKWMRPVSMEKLVYKIVGG